MTWDVLSCTFCQGEGAQAILRRFIDDHRTCFGRGVTRVSCLYTHAHTQSDTSMGCRQAEPSWSIALSSTRRFLAVGSNDHCVTVHAVSVDALAASQAPASSSTQGPVEKVVLAGHTHNIPSLDVSPCGGYVVSGSIDGSMRVWRLRWDPAETTKPAQGSAWRFDCVYRTKMPTDSMEAMASWYVLVIAPRNGVVLSHMWGWTGCGRFGSFPYHIACFKIDTRITVKSDNNEVWRRWSSMGVYLGLQYCRQNEGTHGTFSGISAYRGVR